MKRYLILIMACVGLIALINPATAQAEGPPDLASFHEDIGKLDCKDCHTVNDPKVMPPEASLRLVNQKCMECHGTTANVAAKIGPRLVNKHINPHAGHVVSIECVTCHISHYPSEAYCTKCHAFDMPMLVGNRYKSR